MPFPQIMRRTNRYWANPVALRFANRIPPLFMLEHTGRTSGTVYRIPIFAFPTDDGFVIALTYGPGTDWQRNLEAAGRGEGTYRGQRYLLSDIRLVEGSPDTQPVPTVVRWGLKAIRVRHFLHMQARPAPSLEE